MNCGRNHYCDTMIEEHEKVLHLDLKQRKMLFNQTV